MNLSRSNTYWRLPGILHGQWTRRLAIGTALLLLGTVACGPPTRETARPRSSAPREEPGVGLEDLVSAIVANPPHYEQYMRQVQQDSSFMLLRLIMGSAASREAQSLGLFSGGEESLNVFEQLTEHHVRLYFGKMDAKQTTFLAIAVFDFDRNKMTPKQFDTPQRLGEKLSAEARTVLTIKEDLNRRKPGVIDDLIKKHQLWMNQFVRRRPDGRIEAWLVPFPMVPGIEALGGDHYFLVSEDGSKVIQSVALHSRIWHLNYKDRREPLSALMHSHEAADGDLPTTTDFLKMMASQHLGNVIFQGPRYSILLRILEGQRLFVSAIYDTRKFNVIMKSKGVIFRPLQKP